MLEHGVCDRGRGGEDLLGGDGPLSQQLLIPGDQGGVPVRWHGGGRGRLGAGQRHLPRGAGGAGTGEWAARDVRAVSSARS